MNNQWHGTPEPAHKPKRWSGLKVMAGIMLVVFAVAMAVIISNRLSDEALAVLAGAVCGVGAAIPTSLLVVAVGRWLASNKREEPAPTTPTMTQPTMLVVPPMALPQQPARPPAPTLWDREPAARRFTIVGDEDEFE
jgi:drug/metabolite transporter (DMT)-like permease